jgi:choline monooxygenase
MQQWNIDPDIKKAKTLPAKFYQSQEVYEQLLEQAFAQSWQWVGYQSLIAEKGQAHPVELLSGSLSEPLVLVHDREGNKRCMSNVCTHRGKIIVEQPMKGLRMLTCGYHGRCFKLDGAFRSMPEFKETENFPSPADNLDQLPLKELGVFLFSALDPKLDFEEVFGPIQERMFWFPFDQLTYVEEESQDYLIDTHWALYCDNYLEGFHVPFVHPGLGANLDYEHYATEIFDYCNLQLGIADSEAPAFDLPAEAKDYGKRVHAYYWWVYPNLMLNIYTWGISVNVVEPLAKNKTRVRFMTYLLPGEEKAGFSKEMLHQTEMEDEEVVMSVQKGLQSRFYQSGRFSPTREQGVHHFHRLLTASLDH